jgi:hypothetical protein
MSMNERAGRLVPLVIVVLCVGTVGVPRTEATEPPAKPDPKSAEETKKDDQARRAAERWVTLIVARDVAGLVKMADVPHYHKGGSEILVDKTKKELESTLDHIRDKEFPKDLSIKIIRVTTYAAGSGLLREKKRKQWDAVLRGDDRLVWIKASGTDPGGKPGEDNYALIFRVSDGQMKWVGTAD